MVATFPSQKRRTSQKTKKFYEDCVDAAIAIMEFDDGSGLRASMAEKRINNDLANNILRQEDVDRVVNPWRIQGYDFPLEMRNYPILKSKIDLLVGEEIKRRFDWKIVVRNSEAISDKQNMIKDRYFQVYEEIMRGRAVNEEDLKKKLLELDKWRMYEAKDFRERMSTEIMTYQYDFQKMKFKFNRGFENLCILGEEIYGVTFVDGDVEFDREDPNTFYTLRSYNSQDIEDSDIMISEAYYPIGKIIDTYHEYLTDSQIKDLEDAYGMNRSADPSMSKALTVPANYYQEAYGEDIEIIGGSIGTNAFGGFFDESGNIRRVRVVWRGMRLMGKLRYFEDGHWMYDLVDEYFEPNPDLGQEVEWFWGTEWNEAIRIGKDITIIIGAFPRIGTSVSNPSKCMAPFTGSCYTIGDNKAMSIMSYGRPYQYLFNAGMNRTEKLIVTSHGNIAPMPIHLIPDGWETDDWLYYFSFLNFFVYDAFKEGNKGAATGKLAGTMNQQGQMSFSNSQEIQQNVVFLNMIKGQIDELTGVSPQRQGQIEQRELVGNVERSVTQSSHITEGLFAIHDYTKLKAMALVLEATKYAWRNVVAKRQLVLSDMSSIVLDMDGQSLNSAEYGIFFSNSSADMELFAKLNSLVESGLQTKMLKFSDAMALFMSNSASQIRRKIEQSEQEAIQAAQQQAEAEQARFMEELKAKGVSEDKANALKKYIAELQEETKRMALEKDDLTVEEEPDNLADQQDYELRNKELDMKDKHHGEEMQQKDKDREANTRIKKDEIEVKRLAAKRKPAASNSK